MSDGAKVKDERDSGSEIVCEREKLREREEQNSGF